MKAIDQFRVSLEPSLDVGARGSHVAGKKKKVLVTVNENKKIDSRWTKRDWRPEEYRRGRDKKL